MDLDRDGNTVWTERPVDLMQRPPSRKRNLDHPTGRGTWRKDLTVSLPRKAIWKYTVYIYIHIHIFVQVMSDFLGYVLEVGSTFMFHVLTLM